jgi:hypothetical protein
MPGHCQCTNGFMSSACVVITAMGCNAGFRPVCNLEESLQPGACGGCTCR